MVTMKKISEIAGVSRGTVDRALHNRPGIKPEVRERILAIAKELNYSPNPIAKALQSTSGSTTIGVVMGELVGRFHHQIYESMLLARDNFKSSGINVIPVFIEELAPQAQVEAVMKLVDKGIDGLAIIPIDSIEIKELIGDLVAKDIPVVTFNTDIIGSDRLCFVGQDHELAGKVAGDLMGKVCKRDGDILINFGRTTTLAHVQRTTSFKMLLEDRYKNLNIAKTIVSYDNEDIAYKLVYDYLRKNPDVAGVYSVTATVGSTQAIIDAGLEGKVHHICHDVVPELLAILKTHDAVDFMIGQSPQKQVLYAVKILADYLMFGKEPEKENINIAIDIRIRDNADMEDDNVI